MSMLHGLTCIVHFAKLCFCVTRALNKRKLLVQDVCLWVLPNKPAKCLFLTLALFVLSFWSCLTVRTLVRGTA